MRSLFAQRQRPPRCGKARGSKTAKHTLAGLTIRSSRSRFAASAYVLAFSTTPCRYAGRLNSGVRLQESALKVRLKDSRKLVSSLAWFAARLCRPAFICSVRTRLVTHAPGLRRTVLRDPSAPELLRSLTCPYQLNQSRQVGTVAA